MFDVSPLTPQARPIALAAAQIYYKHTHPWLIGLLIHGSALKGGFIPGCSDIDFQLHLKGDAFDSTRELPLSVTLAIQRDLSQIDPAPFQYIQAYTKSPDLVSHKVRGHVGPIPGAYHMIYGHLPVPEATVAEVLQGARKTLERNTNFIANTSEDLLGHGGGRLERSIRFMCTDVWPTLYSMLTLRAEQPLAIWRLPKEAAIAQLPEDEPASKAIRQFYRRVYAYYNNDYSVESALAVIEQGVEFLQAADLWYREEYAQ